MCAQPIALPLTVRADLPPRVCLSIGGVVVALRNSPGEAIPLPPDATRFIVPDCTPDIDLEIERASRVGGSTGEAVFDSGAVWKLFREGKDFVFDFYTSTLGVAPYKKLRVDSNFSSGQVILNGEALRGCDSISPLEYPADELLITNCLARGSGVEVHGCGLVDSETGGHLLLGHSGAGKSTTTRLWKAARNVEVLSDDRIILRFHHGQLWMYGTPWHGELALSSPSSAQIKRIFILKHGHRNAMARLAASQAVGELFARSFPPFHSALGLERTVEFLSRVVKTVPCYEFTFIPDPSAVEAVTGFHD